MEEELRKMERSPGRRRRKTRELATTELQRLWQEGIASGPGCFTSIGQIKKEARRRASIARREKQTQKSSCGGRARLRATASKDGNELGACFHPSRRSALRAEL